MKKKLVAALLTAAMAMSLLAGCGSSNNTTDTTADTTAATEAAGETGERGVDRRQAGTKKDAERAMTA